MVTVVSLDCLIIKHDYFFFALKAFAEVYFITCIDSYVRKSPNINTTLFKKNKYIAVLTLLAMNLLVQMMSGL